MVDVVEIVNHRRIGGKDLCEKSCTCTCICPCICDFICDFSGSKLVLQCSSSKRAIVQSWLKKEPTHIIKTNSICELEVHVPPCYSSFCLTLHSIRSAIRTDPIN